MTKGKVVFAGTLRVESISVPVQLIRSGRANVTVLESKDKWFGVTYKEDKPLVVESFKALIDAGVYKERLFG